MPSELSQAPRMTLSLSCLSCLQCSLLVRVDFVLAVWSPRLRTALCARHRPRWLVYMALLRAFKWLFKGFKGMFGDFFRIFRTKNWPKTARKTSQNPGKIPPEAFPEDPEIANKPVSPRDPGILKNRSAERKKSFGLVFLFPPPWL